MMIDFPFVPVFNDFEQYGAFLGIKRDKEQVVEDEQLTTLNLLEFCLKRPFDFGHFQCPEQFWAIGIESADSPFTLPRAPVRRPDSFSP